MLWIARLAGAGEIHYQVIDHATDLISEKELTHCFSGADDKNRSESSNFPLISAEMQN